MVVVRRIIMKVEYLRELVIVGRVKATGAIVAIGGRYWLEGHSIYASWWWNTINSGGGGVVRSIVVVRLRYLTIILVSWRGG